MAKKKIKEVLKPINFFIPLELKRRFENKAHELSKLNPDGKKQCLKGLYEDALWYYSSGWEGKK